MKGSRAERRKESQKARWERSEKFPVRTKSRCIQNSYVTNTCIYIYRNDVCFITVWLQQITRYLTFTYDAVSI